MNTTEEGQPVVHHPPVTRDEVVVGIDESPAAAAALRWAAGHSRATGLPLRLVRTWQVSVLASAAATSGACRVPGGSSRGRPGPGHQVGARHPRWGRRQRALDARSP